ncbi:hypothetical protein GCM10023147_20060 [Tsukamurella soli]|uniref:Uncharacterized protein n=1 Tax=Tsukamurella soli TaxID=644556 RepID=A0ABP8JI87_9ACTN
MSAVPSWPGPGPSWVVPSRAVSDAGAVSDAAVDELMSVSLKDLQPHSILTDRSVGINGSPDHRFSARIDG